MTNDDMMTDGPDPARPMRVLIVTDAWRPQVNGVVRTLEETRKVLVGMGCEVEVIAPQESVGPEGAGWARPDFRTLPLPTYPDIRISLFPRAEVRRRMLAFAPHAVHIATEGPLGWAARALCLRWGMPFTTSYHTQFPEYVRARAPVPERLTYAVVRRFHNAGGCTMVTTPSMVEFLRPRGFAHLAAWTRGVDLSRFDPGLRWAPDGVYAGLPRPVWVNVGRVAVEKNIETFLSLDLPGTKVVVGDGPARAELEARFPDAVFTGAKGGEELARHFADADVFVFPSLTDTFGLVIIEAMACGTPVAAFPATGPIDIIPGSGAGVLAEDVSAEALRAACLAALEVPRATARAHAETFSWQAAGERFFELLTPDYRPKARERWRRLRRMGARL